MASIADKTSFRVLLGVAGLLSVGLLYAFFRYVGVPFLLETREVNFRLTPNMILAMQPYYYTFEICIALAIVVAIAFFVRKTILQITAVCLPILLVGYCFFQIKNTRGFIAARIDAYDLKLVDDFLRKAEELATKPSLKKRDFESLRYAAHRELGYALIRRDRGAPARYVFITLIEPDRAAHANSEVHRAFSAFTKAEIPIAKLPQTETEGFVAGKTRRIVAEGAQYIYPAELFDWWLKHKSEFDALPALDAYIARKEISERIAALPRFNPAIQNGPVKLTGLGNRVAVEIDPTSYRLHRAIGIRLRGLDPLVTEVQPDGQWMVTHADAGLSYVLIKMLNNGIARREFHENLVQRIDYYAVPLHRRLQPFKVKNDFRLQPLADDALKSFLSHPETQAVLEKPEGVRIVELAIWTLKFDPTREDLLQTRHDLGDETGSEILSQENYYSMDKAAFQSLIDLCKKTGVKITNLKPATTE